MRWAVVLFLFLTGHAMASPDPKALARELMRDPPKNAPDAPVRMIQIPEMGRSLPDPYEGLRRAKGIPPGQPIPNEVLRDWLGLSPK